MTAFGGVFRAPKLEGVEEGEDSGQRARLVGLDLDHGVVRVRAARPASEPDSGTDPEPAEETDAPRD